MGPALTEALQETLAVFDGSGVPQTTTEVADRLDLGRRSTYDRLSRLVDHDRLDTKKVGAKARVWWRPSVEAGAGPFVNHVLGDVDVGVFVLDEEFDVVWTNEATERYFGIEREAVLGADKQTLVEERIAPLVADEATFRETVLATYADNTYAEGFQCCVRPGDSDEERTLEHRSHPIDAGRYAGGRVELYYDVTEHTRLKRTHEETREELDSLVDAVEEYAIFTLDVDGRVRTWNAGAERTYGYTIEEVTDEHVSVFYSEEARETGVPERNLSTAAAEGSTEVEGWRSRADGSRFWGDVTITAVHDDEGNLDGYVKITRDRTERKRAKREREVLYETTRAIAEAKSVEAGLEATLESVCEVTGWPYAEAWLPNDDGTLGRADAGYREEGFDELVASSERRTFKRGEGLPGRVWASGESEWADDLVAEDSRLERALGVPITAEGDVVAVLAFLVPESSTEVERLVQFATSVATDLGVLVTRRRLEERVARERDLVDRVLETNPVGMMVLDGQGECARINSRAEELLGVPDGSAEAGPLAKPLYNTDGNPVAHEERPSSRVLETGEPVDDWQGRVGVEDGTHRWLSMKSAPMLDDDGEVERVVTAVRDITQLMEQARRLERQHERLKAELSDVFDRISDGFYGLGLGLRFTFVNDRAAELLDEGRAFLVGSDIREALSLGEEFETALETALETQEPASVEDYYPSIDGWFEHRIYPSDSGLSVYFRDITERKARERELEESRRRYRTLVENFPNGAVSLVDDELRYTTFGGTPIEAAESTSTELKGESLEEVLPEEVAGELCPRYEAALNGETTTAELEFADRSYMVRTLPVRDADGDVFAAMGMSQDITGRKARERELREYERVVETISDGVYVLDGDGRFRRVNDAFVSMTRFEREELHGAHASVVFGKEFDERDKAARRSLEADGDAVVSFEEDIHTADDDVITVESRFKQFEVDGRDGRVGVVRDITERKRREREREMRLRQQEVVANLGQRALREGDVDGLLSDAVELVADTLDNEYCKVLELDEDADELLLREGVGWDAGLVGSATVSAVEVDAQAAFTLSKKGPVVVTDLETEPRFDGPDLLTDHGVRSGISVTIGPPEDPWGIVGTHDTSPKGITEHDVNFVQSVANVLSTAIDRNLYQRELERQHQRLSALNNLNEIVREISRAIIEQSTREEIEGTVCERLADSPSYLFAWTGEVDPATEEVTVRTEARTGGYLEGLTISVDPEDERSKGPTGRALRTGEIQVCQNVQEGGQHDPWREHVEAYGVEASAAIPIVNDDTVYGVLNIYADREGAFTGEERSAVGTLGEVVGHAIAAAERKRALMSDELVELEFQVRDVFDSADASVEGHAPITFDHTVQVDDETFLVYGASPPGSVQVVASLVEEFSHWEAVTFDSDDRRDGDPVGFELRLSEPPVLSTVAAVGGTVDEAVIEDGGLRMTVHLSPSADVRRVLDVVEETFPNAEMHSRQQISRPVEGQAFTRQRLTTELTDRQRTALEVAYRTGFFEWPRESTGEDVAESMDVAPPTFHKHLRKAERKVFGTLFSAPTESSG